MQIVPIREGPDSDDSDGDENENSKKLAEISPPSTRSPSKLAQLGVASSVSIENTRSAIISTAAKVDSSLKDGKEELLGTVKKANMKIVPLVAYGSDYNSDDDDDGDDDIDTDIGNVRLKVQDSFARDKPDAEEEGGETNTNTSPNRINLPVKSDNDFDNDEDEITGGLRVPEPVTVAKKGPLKIIPLADFNYSDDDDDS